MIVLGLGFGDEGKGHVTSWLCSKTENPLVVRFNGGHQAGHTVNYKGKRHVFSSFGSGSLQGVPTYWSKNCTFYPNSFLREYKMLDEPKIYVHPLCPVTTPYDIEFNRAAEKIRPHGSVGMGFGATIQRQEANYKLFVQDLYHEKVLKEKLDSIGKYYNYNGVFQQDMEKFLKSVEEIKNIITLSDDSIIDQFNPIFEGAQGILLDQDHGFFPNVTRSNTTSKNVFEMYLYQRPQEVYYITRTYQTRHGKGFMTNEDQELKLKNNENETNKSHAYQGEFRIAPLDIDLLNYALRCDENYLPSAIKKNLVITCMDQHKINIPELLSKLNTKFDKVYFSLGDSLEHISEYSEHDVRPGSLTNIQRFA